MYSITGAGATYAFTVSGVASATYSITGADAAQVTAAAGATSLVTGESAVKVTVCAGAANSLFMPPETPEPSLTTTGGGTTRGQWRNACSHGKVTRLGFDKDHIYAQHL